MIISCRCNKTAEPRPTVTSEDETFTCRGYLIEGKRVTLHSHYAGSLGTSGGWIRSVAKRTFLIQKGNQDWGSAVDEGLESWKGRSTL